MIRFSETEEDLILIYKSETDDGEYVRFQLEETGKVSLCARNFHLSKDRLIRLPEDDDSGSFVFAVGLAMTRPYYTIDREVLGIEYDLSFHSSIVLERKTFVAERNISIFRRLNSFGLTNLVVGGDHENALPEEVFLQLLKDFPTTYEMDRYAEARIDAVLGEHLSSPTDFRGNYEGYLNKKKSRKGSQPLRAVAPYEAAKFDDLMIKLEEMLSQAGSYSEAQWQKEILQVVLLLFPRYIRAFSEGPVRDSWASKNRKVDFLLVDATGFIDVIEIKKPFDQKLVTPNCYRDNHVPLRELSGTIMQVEKYIYHFNRWGEKGEKKLREKFGPELPEGLDVKIVNPNGIIIMGRDNDLTESQINDFEVIRRKYRNVVDIITYDDLLRRLITIRDSFNTLSHETN